MMMKPSQKISLWLFTCAAAVFLMALIGAVTRLTESGLSIVEWKPITGVLPPFNAADWNHAFDLYKTSPQYQKVNLGMSLEDFKKIYFWEWLHRLWGRLIGAIYFMPLLWFWAKKEIPIPLRKPLAIILALGFLQGAMGWFMVKSGLVDQPAVSHYRLAAHLSLAMLIFCALLHTALPAQPAVPLRRWLKGVAILAGMTMIWGAFVAGLRAGLIYNSFPMMGDHFWPGEIFYMSPWWINFFENHATVQFTHRILALFTLTMLVTITYKSFSFELPSKTRKLFIALGLIACLQVALGITTLLTGVNIIIATTHQAGAFILLGLLTALLRKER